jgi:uncharacterized protein (TIGR00369 family)
VELQQRRGLRLLAVRIADATRLAGKTGLFGGNVVGVNNNTDFLRAVTEGTVYAESEPVHRGRRQQLWLVTIRDQGDRMVARGQVRLQNLELVG